MLSSFDKIQFIFSGACMKHQVDVYALLIKRGEGKRMKIMQEEGKNSLRCKNWNNLLLFTTLINKYENKHYIGLSTKRTLRLYNMTTFLPNCSLLRKYKAALKKQIFKGSE